MRPPLRALLAVLVALPTALALGFLLSPDPTGFVPVAVATVLTAVFAVALYRVLPGATTESPSGTD